MRLIELRVQRGRSRVYGLDAHEVRLIDAETGEEIDCGDITLNIPQDGIITADVKRLVISKIEAVDRND
jgi:hypothetical protein